MRSRHRRRPSLEHVPSIPASAKPRTAPPSAILPGSSTSAIAITFMWRSKPTTSSHWRIRIRASRSATPLRSFSCGPFSSTKPATGSHRDAEHNMRTMDRNLQRELIEAVAMAVIAHAEELTSLDQAIGDGDHGINMKRGFEAVLADIDGLAAKPLPEALRAIGMALLMKIGGASGPLYGTLFMTLGKELPAEPSAEEVARALAAAIAAIKA